MVELGDEISLAGHLLHRTAVVDFGSNSFKLRISERSANGWRKVVSEKAVVRIIEEMDADGGVSADARARATSAAARFGEIIEKSNVNEVYAFATEAFRRLRDGAILTELSRSLGHPISLLPPSQEALLCWSGVSEMVGAPTVPRLVVDVGGGSMQLIFGQSSRPLHFVSLPVGCVTWMKRHFSGAEFSPVRFQRAVDEAVEEMKQATAAFPSLGGTELIGASGAFRACLLCTSQGERSVGELPFAQLKAYFARIPAGVLDPETRFPSVALDRAQIMVGCASLVLAVGALTQGQSVYVTKSGIRRGAETSGVAPIK
jgi:exopolyphosphatase / guanosine-5'-triphosphate,3'-diphosphate pyrophosphatase